MFVGRGLVVKRPGVPSKVQMLNLVLGVGSFPFYPPLAEPPFENSDLATKLAAV